MLPEFHAGLYEVVATSGLRRNFGTSGYVLVADMTAQASQGTGYRSFIYPTLVGECEQPNQPATRYMWGWSQGTLFRNNVAAPPFSEGHFSLSVTVTSGDQKATLYKPRGYGCHVNQQLLFPWG